LRFKAPQKNRNRDSFLDFLGTLFERINEFALKFATGRLKPALRKPFSLALAKKRIY
jgi:hypothetical protein